MTASVYLVSNRFACTPEPVSSRDVRAPFVLGVSATSRGENGVEQIITGWEGGGTSGVTPCGLHGEVLVLNSDYEPLNVCNLRRAILLICLGKVEVLHSGPVRIRTFEGEMHSPSVIKLRQHVKRPVPQLRLSRRGVFARDGYTCQDPAGRPQRT